MPVPPSTPGFEVGTPNVVRVNEQGKHFRALRDLATTRSHIDVIWPLRTSHKLRWLGSARSAATLKAMTRIIAHRGASQAFTENTLEAFRGADEMGADWVELDVRRTGCDSIVVHHDAHLGDGRLIRDLSVDDLPDHVSTLEAVIEACGEMGVNIEIKNDAADPDFDPEHQMVPEVVRIARALLRPDTTLITSFDMGAINAVHDIDKAMPTGLLTFDAVGPEVSIGRAKAHDHSALNPWDGIVTNRWVAEAHAAELDVYVWTVDAPKRMKELAAMGVDGIITNVPDVAVKTLR